MRLTEKEYEQFLRVHPKLMYYVAEREQLMPKKVSSFEDYMNLDLVEKIPSRDRIYERSEYIDEFIKENPYKLSSEDIEVAKGFNDFKKRKFWVVKSLKNYTIFLDKEYAYGVLALGDSFSSFWNSRDLPIIIETVLLPFKDKIVYDGIMKGNNVFYGRGISSSVNLKYKEAKAKHGIITSLPVSKRVAQRSSSAEDDLKLYMKTANSRTQYEFEIEDLLEKNPSLNDLYYKLWGKINARVKKKRLKELGLAGYYYAIYIDTVIASSRKKSDLEKEIGTMLDGQGSGGIYIFKV